KLIQYPDYLLFGEALPFQVFPPWPILAFHLTIGTIFGEQVTNPLSASGEGELKGGEVDSLFLFPSLPLVKGD
ncbi:MAG: hypothetical protein ABR886_10295, partial [Dehalococcoidales bacterium]